MAANLITASQGEAIRVAQLDRPVIARGKFDLDVMGRYARPDAFCLSVDTSAKAAVTLVGAAEEPRPAVHAEEV